MFATFVKVDEELFEELEEALITADVGMETSMYIIETLRDRVKKARIEDADGVKAKLQEIIAEIMAEQETAFDLSGTPPVILVIGINGVGKTTTIGKLAARLKADGKRVMLAAADTFRAAAIDQLQIWADRCGCEIIKHSEGSDPSRSRIRRGVGGEGARRGCAHFGYGGAAAQQEKPNGRTR